MKEDLYIYIHTKYALHFCHFRAYGSLYLGSFVHVFPREF